MGRSAGFIPAAARLADPDREMPLQLYLAESEHTLETMLDGVNRELSRSGRLVLVVSEGFDVGSLGERHDAFGHVEYGASRSTVAQKVVNYLNDHEIYARGQAVGQVPGVLQRTTSIFASTVDQEEAYGVGRAAVEVALRDGTGYMATIRRRSSSPYRSYFDKVPLETVANSVRRLPASWISEDQIDVTDDFIRYARPLIGSDWPSVPLIAGRQRFTRLDLNLVEQKLPSYVPTGLR
jgi:6-phosphofructokinase 1